MGEGAVLFIFLFLIVGRSSSGLIMSRNGATEMCRLAVRAYSGDRDDYDVTIHFKCRLES